ncbi:hypothetical protein NPIL_282351 [Nephila pilipes]|uniref:Uncharacterized protein n=1 Tax=Nephila pilipes TaxID=299642 RepID=A0A8X6QA08_NEPPI|nr:hypothetical protein NPIL_282351 [Nephila pilipes]
MDTSIQHQQKYISSQPLIHVQRKPPSATLAETGLRKLMFSQKVFNSVFPEDDALYYLEVSSIRKKNSWTVTRLFQAQLLRSCELQLCKSSCRLEFDNDEPHHIPNSRIELPPQQ